jgi:hypothetical protein
MSSRPARAIGRREAAPCADSWHHHEQKTGRPVVGPVPAGFARTFGCRRSRAGRRLSHCCGPSCGMEEVVHSDEMDRIVSIAASSARRSRHLAPSRQRLHSQARRCQRIPRGNTRRRPAPPAMLIPDERWQRYPRRSDSGSSPTPPRTHRAPHELALTNAPDPSSAAINLPPSSASTMLEAVERHITGMALTSRCFADSP